MACTKLTLIEQLEDRLHLPTKEAKDTVELLLEIIKQTLESGEDLLISGFGKFEVKEKAQRKGRNPATGKSMVLPPRRVVTFKCAGKLRDRINSGTDS